MTFADLGLSPELLKAVTDSGYTTPTPIQQQAIPQVLRGRDVLGIAQTGTGKTAGFTLPMIDILASGRPKARMPRSLILEPTRELAAQVAESFEKYGKYHKLTTALLIGGVSFGDQDKKIDRGVDVLIATPGRLLDHFERGKLMMSGVQTLVIDEADRMLDMGFIPDVERICKLLPFTRQTLFFSATMPPEITRLSEQFLHNPIRIEVARPATAATTIEQKIVIVGSLDKRDALRRIASTADVKNAIVFCNRKRDVDVVAKSMQKHGFSAAPIHGDLDQSVRTRTLEAFKNGTIQFLIASDVAARGLDIPLVSHVFNFDVPIHPDDYVHRIGRTGRAGRSGIALTIGTPADAKYIDAIERLKGAPIERFTIDGLEGRKEDDGEGASSRPARGGRGARSGGGRERGGKGREAKPRHDDAAALEIVAAPEPEQTDMPLFDVAPAIEPVAVADVAAEAPTQAQRRERGKRRDRREPREAKPAIAEAPRAVEATHAPEPKRHHEPRDAKRGHDQKNDRARQDGGREQRVVGFGDNMPAFLARPVPKIRKVEAA